MIPSALDRWDDYTLTEEAMIEHTDTDHARISTRCASSEVVSVFVEVEVAVPHLRPAVR
jgi:hypothetical protein